MCWFFSTMVTIAWGYRSKLLTGMLSCKSSIQLEKQHWQVSTGTSAHKAHAVMFFNRQNIVERQTNIRSQIQTRSVVMYMVTDRTSGHQRYKMSRLSTLFIPPLFSAKLICQIFTDKVLMQKTCTTHLWPCAYSMLIFLHVWQLDLSLLSRDRGSLVLLFTWNGNF